MPRNNHGIFFWIRKGTSLVKNIFTTIDSKSDQEEEYVLEAVRVNQYDLYKNFKIIGSNNIITFINLLFQTK